jgi:hypothetical protein
MTTEGMDWEAAMKTARRSAEKAATLGERTVGGVAEMLHRQNRLSADLAAATKTLAQIDARLSSLIEESRTTRGALAHLSRSQAPRSRQWPSLALSVPLAVLIASVVSLWN